MLSRRTRIRGGSGWLAIVLAGLVFGTAALDSYEASAQTVVRVEEDWELVVGAPDTTVTAPQITCTISPSADTEGLYAAFELNQRSQPSFSPGGIQIQVWDGDALLTARDWNTSAQLATPNETVRWTQTMTVNGTNLVFEVLNGSSTTWGAFGGQGYLKATVTSPLLDLNGYHPDVSVANSGVSYAGNRVTSLVLREVRLVLATGVVLRDTTPRTVQ
jgi:hypothetical protein